MFERTDTKRIDHNIYLVIILLGQIKLWEVICKKCYIYGGLGNYVTLFFVIWQMWIGTYPPTLVWEYGLTNKKQ